MANKVFFATLFVCFLLVSCCEGEETPESVCCTNPYAGCFKGNAEDESRCYTYCSDNGCKGGECKNWGHPAGECHCYC